VARPRDDRQKDLLRPALEEIIDLGHPLVRLAREIDWGFLDRRFASVCAPGPGQPGLPTRLVAGLLILKNMHNLSDEVLCARWLENPYYQFFCGELSFCHRLPFDRSSLTHWRQRLGAEQLVALIQESLSVAHKTGALASRDLERVVVDTTVQPKAIAHPTDARLCHRALEKLVDRARRHQVRLRQSYRRVAKRAAIMVGRYTHAHQFKRARRELKFLRVRLGRVIRDIRRKIAGNKTLKERFADLLALAVRVRFQDHRQCGPKVYALHAPEVECIGNSPVETAERLLKLVAIATHAAVLTLPLLQARDGRSGEPASVVFTADELGTLDALHTQYSGRTPRQQNPHPQRSLAWAAWLIARLGGWDGYPSSRPPGPITLKIGIDKLRLLALGWGLRNVCMP